MRQFRRLVLLGACAVTLAAPAAMAESQSSDSSSNCSNGRCTRVDRYTVEDGAGRRGWVRREEWREDRERVRREARPSSQRYGGGGRSASDDDDDDD